VEETNDKSGDETPHRGGVFRWVWIAGLAVVLYVLSIGPAAKLSPPGSLGDRVGKVIYAPLFFTCSHWKPAGRFLAWYFEVWHVEFL
jgi:hypothetical protein